MKISPEQYDAWYASARGAWMGEAESSTMIRLSRITPGASLLDAGCGSGWFSRRFANAGCEVTALDSDRSMLLYARAQARDICYLQGDMQALPLRAKSVDIVTSVTSLCFVADERRALAEMIRVARRRIVLGLLHRHSLLYLYKHGRGSYAGARWHTRNGIAALLTSFPEIRTWHTENLLFWPGSPQLGRRLEKIPLLPARFGGFMAVVLAL